KIFVGGVISNNAIIDARKSDLELKNLDLGTIYAKNIKIEVLSRGNIIANKVEINQIVTGYNNSSISIVGENIDIKEYIKSPQLNISLITKQSIFKKSKEILETQKVTNIGNIDGILEKPPFEEYVEKYKLISSDYNKANFLDKLEEIYKYNNSISKLAMTDMKGILVDPMLKNFLDVELKKLKLSYLDRSEQLVKLDRKIKGSESKMRDIVGKRLTPLLDNMDKINNALKITDKVNNSSVKIGFHSNARTKDISIIKFQNPGDNGNMFEDIDDKTFQELLKISNVITSKSEKISVVFGNGNFYYEELEDNNENEQ
ncbi:MAG: hypothetical protein PHR68_04965, partial [Candidatus Gracilibacteria bacterium]|nr:hypothetical protein [Candidatus Gracilibacteria bacterium]